MCITEYDEDRAFAEQREEGIEEGIEIGIEKGKKEGREEGRLDTLIELVKRGMLTLIDAAKMADMTVSEFEEKTAGLKA